MAFQKPTFAALAARIKGDISSRTEGSAYIPRSVELIFSLVLAYIAYSLYGYFDYIQRQLLPTTCGEAGLLAWGSILKLPRKPATQSVGTATFVGTNGVVLPSSTTLKASNGALFTVLTGGTVSAGTVTVLVRANVAGSDGNLSTSAPIALVSPLAGLTSSGLVASPGLSGGTDIEDLEDFRARILSTLRQPPKGGGPGDYVSWALEVPGVTRAWEYGTRMGLGTVSIAFTMDDRVNPIPLGPDVTAVQAHIDAVKPLDMRAAYAIAPVANPINLTISLRPNTFAVQTAVTAALVELFKSDDVQHEQALAKSKIDEVISTAAGEDAHNIDSYTSLTPSTWGLLTLGTITYATL